MRRGVFLSSAFAAAAIARPAAANGSHTPALAAIEARTGGRLGVYAFDSSDGREIAYREHERFAMCSTFKFLAVAAVLHRVDRGREQLGRHVAYGEADLLAYAPVTKAHLTQGFMTVEELCEAAIVYSDNTAANLLLASIGGPKGVTQFAHLMGDRLTNLTRTEPTLNTAIPGEIRDTTTPFAMAANLRKVDRHALSAASKAKIEGWMTDCKTGLDTLRAGFPAPWRVADKTGSGGANNALGFNNTRNDIAIAWPPHRPPIFVTSYLTQSKVSSDASAAALAAVGKLVGRAFA